MSARNRYRRSRGQALAEVSLGLLVFVTVLVFGIHFAEVVFTQMKVTEAAAAPIWDTTAGDLNDIPVPFSYDPSSALAAARNDAQQRYQDFDGRTNANGAAPSQVFTVARNLQLACTTGGLNRFWGQLAPFPYIPAVYQDNMGISCTGEARITSIRIPSNFVDQGPEGFFRAPHKEGIANQTGIKVCAVGRPNGLNGPCTGSLTMAVDDWGLQNDNLENVICPVLPYGIPCPNLPYWSSVFAIFQLGGGGQGNAHEQLVNFTMRGNVPFMLGRATSFYMSYVGEELMFQQPLLWAGDGMTPLWSTTPFLFMPSYAASYAMREGCYLGYPCNTSTLAQP